MEQPCNYGHDFRHNSRDRHRAVSVDHRRDRMMRDHTEGCATKPVKVFIPIL